MSKHFVCAACVAVCILCTGCTYAKLDTLRPEINGAHAMVVLPDSILENTEDVRNSGSVTGFGDSNNGGADSGDTGDPGFGTGTVTGGSGVGAGVGTVADGSIGVVQQDTLSADDYKRYLLEYVYAPISESVEASGAKDVYFRVFHSGYSVAGGQADDYVSRSSTLDRTLSTGSIGMVAGKPIHEFVYKWLSLTSNNDRIIAGHRQTALDAITSAAGGENGSGWNATWEQLASTTKLSRKYLAMMHGDPAGCNTLQEYYSAVESEVLGVIPCIPLEVNTSKTQKSLVRLNYVESSDTAFTYKMPLDNVKKIFTAYNQHQDCVRLNSVDVNLKDGYCRLFGYVDGFTKTVVLLGTDGNRTLQEALGQECYADIAKTYDAILFPTEVSALQNLEGLKESQVIETGSRGRA